MTQIKKELGPAAIFFDSIYGNEYTFLYILKSNIYKEVALLVAIRDKLNFPSVTFFRYCVC